MSIVKSTWTTVPVPQDGALPAAEWAGAGKIAIPAGFLMVKNDEQRIYLALDLVGDTGNDVGTNDYFWFVIDSDANGAVTVNRDVMYGLFPGEPNKLGRWLMAGPNTTWPASSSQVIDSTVRVGFGPSPNSAAPHRIWEISLSLAELGLVVDPTLPPPTLKFGLRVASSTPGFTFDFPASPLSAFNNFHTLVLATASSSISYPPGTAGPVIAGVGWIPFTRIAADGYATITEPYRIQPREAAFAGTMDLIGNSVTLASLWAAGARRYRVLHRSGNTLAALGAAPETPIRQAWANYRWDGTTYVWESFGPDAADRYPMQNPGVDYMIKALLFQWDSSKEPNNLHQFRIEFFDSAGAAVAAPPATPLTLRLDNQLPEAKVLDILHNGASVPACSIVSLDSPTDGVQIVAKAFDPEGHLHSYSIGAQWGNNQSAGIFSDSYTSHLAPDHRWQGVASQTVPTPPAEWVPPVTCAYMFRVTAVARTTNGYWYAQQHSSEFRTLTLLKTGIRVMASPIVPLVSESMPFGFAGGKQPVVQGIEPTRLGADTLR